MCEELSDYEIIKHLIPSLLSILSNCWKYGIVLYVINMLLLSKRMQTVRCYLPVSNFMVNVQFTDNNFVVDQRNYIHRCMLYNMSGTLQTCWRRLQLSQVFYSLMLSC